MHDFLTEHLPEVLLRVGPLKVLWWQWLALPVVIAVSFLIGAILGRVTRFLLGRLAGRTEATWDDALIEAIAGPIRWAWSLLIFRGLVQPLELHADAAHAVRAIVSTMWFLCVFWAVINVLDQIRISIAASEWSRRRPIARSLVPLAVRVGKVLVGIIAFISLLSELGYPVAGLIAGLGIGGIAFALAAQKTIENLFGAFSIGLDQPFREGDGVKIGDHLGVVESIGLRSTRIRTAERTVVTIPNAQVAESRIESFAERDRLKLGLKLNLDYGTTGKQLRGVLDEVRAVLREHPQIHKDGIDVRFIGFAPSALEVEVSAWFESNDNDKFRLAREQILMTFLEIVEKHGTALAFPSQSLYVKELPARASA
ncbi:MAG TPA: mechanosensitive ion channel family protein [Kofleriaceae bacterium]|nr:mechanosensitive ion channel family protein [Kofleriaceae bacterium]